MMFNIFIFQVFNHRFEAQNSLAPEDMTVILDMLKRKKTLYNNL